MQEVIHSVKSGVDGEFKECLGYMVRPFLKERKEKETDRESQTERYGREEEREGGRKGGRERAGKDDDSRSVFSHKSVA